MSKRKVKQEDMSTPLAPGTTHADLMPTAHLESEKPLANSVADDLPSKLLKTDEDITTQIADTIGAAQFHSIAFDPTIYIRFNVVATEGGGKKLDIAIAEGLEVDEVAKAMIDLLTEVVVDKPFVAPAKKDAEADYKTLKEAAKINRDPARFMAAHAFGHIPQ